ncbi:two pore potassium channel protein sup-9-like isoform X2 [Pocillopora damicornis]|uniref:two pore potassium channel protein sup-9-like isoform X2 n=1 Tax=Pocillopora damicornis TaxID=46731 RepID=UPI000F5546E2|nr:two pore potassium channel protein sup-9-like isoform X2 [Pocillopora damicornis]
MEMKRKTRTLFLRVAMLIVYLTSGAAIFSALEHDGQSTGSHFAKKIDQLKENMTQRFNETMDVIDLYIAELRFLFEKAHRCKYSHNDWSYYQSLYFVGSVTTTIGYGHLAPKTQEGRLFLIFFALFGIPLNLLTLQSIGEHINYGIHLLIKYFEKAAFERELPTQEHIKCFAINTLLITLWIPLGGIMYYYSEREFGWTYLDCVYYCFVALSTIGFGDLVPNEGKEPDSPYERGMWIVRVMYLALGLSLLSSVFTSVLSAAKEIQSVIPCKRGVENQTPSNLGRDFKFERDRPSIKSYSNSTISTSIEELNFPDNYYSKERPNTVEHRNETETWSREDRSSKENCDKLGKKTSENMK